MPLGRFVLALVSLAVPVVASAQPWADAYRAGDYQKAADLLHPIVTDFDYEQSGEPDPARSLAVMYARGLGVDRDPIAACALAQAAHGALHQAAPRYGTSVERAREFDVAIKESDSFVRTQCEPLSHDDRLTAVNAIGCPAFGMRERVLAVGRHTVLVDRRGLSLAASKQEPTIINTCAAIVARVRALSIQPPDDAALGVTPRHFVELLLWVRAEDGQGSGEYVLQLHMFEVRGSEIVGTEIERLHTLRTWPHAVLPPNFDSRFSLQMIRSGHVRWRFDGDPPRRGWILLPEESDR